MHYTLHYNMSTKRTPRITGHPNTHKNFKTIAAASYALKFSVDICLTAITQLPTVIDPRTMINCLISPFIAS